LIVGLVGVITCVIVRAFEQETEYTITAAEVERIEKISNKKLASFE
jgi:hypothetical protein